MEWLHKRTIEINLGGQDIVLKFKRCHISADLKCLQGLLGTCMPRPAGLIAYMYI
jgi:hypothetical protein